MVSPIDLIYAQRLKALRIKKGLHQKEATNLLGFNTQQQYSELEQGHKQFTDDLIQLICEKFEIKKEEFVSGDSNYFNESPYANSQNGTNNSINDKVVVEKLLHAKDETIKSKDELLEKYRKENETLRGENEALKKENERLKKS